MAKLPSLSKSEQEKLDAARGINSIKSISPEMYTLAKFGYFYGYDGVKAYMTGEIGHKDAQELIRATEMIWYEYAHNTALGTFYGSKDGKSFNKGIKTFTDKIKVEQ